MAAGGSDGAVYVWSVSEGTVVAVNRSSSANGAVESVSWMRLVLVDERERDWLISCDADGRIVCWV